MGNTCIPRATELFDIEESEQIPCAIDEHDMKREYEILKLKYRLEAEEANRRVGKFMN
jgi:hypothetical protein